MKTIRILTALLAVCLFLTALASCKGNTPGTGTSGSTSASETGTETTEVTTGATEKKYTDLEPVNFGGKEFTILAREDSGSLWTSVEWYSDGSDPNDRISQAVYDRNEMVQRDYNCFVTQKGITGGSLLPTAQSAYLSESQEYDVIVMPFVSQICNMAVNGWYKDLAKLENLDLNDPWWDSKTNDSLSLYGHYYTACGDINVTDDKATWCCLFNKYMITDWAEAIADPYETVKNGKWTLEEMYKNAKIVSSTEHETYGKGLYGLATEFDTLSAYLAGAGAFTIVHNTDGSISNNIKSHNFESVIHKIYDLMKDDNVQVFGDNTTDGSKGYSAIDWGSLYKAFLSDSALYCTCAMATLWFNGLSDMSSGFGILPIPKYSEEQTDYVSTLQAGNANGVSILASQQNAEQVAAFLTALAAASVDTLSPAFYDNALMARKVPDEESYEMVEKILGNRVVDIGLVISNEIRTVLSNTVKTRTGYQFVDIRTTYASVLENNLENAIKGIKNEFKTQE